MDSDLPELIYTEDNTIFPYSCEESEFVDQHHEHILNSNFKIIRDNELEEIFINRPKFGEEKIISSKKKPKFDIIAKRNESNEAWCTKHGHDKNLFNEWKSNIILKLGSMQRKKNSASFKKDYCDTACKRSRF